MHFRQMPCQAEIHAGEGPGGTLLHGRVESMQAALVSEYAHQVQTIYLDPPFNTGKSFALRQRVGTAGWETGKPFVELPTYSDRWETDEEYLALMAQSIRLAHTLLSDDGSLFFHIDARMHAHIRLMLDEVFGANNFVNEIIWAYQSGGRSLAHFSRKHDIILFYRKSTKAFFSMQAIGMPRAKNRRNHMRRSVDETGRSYRSIVSQGKEYRYYDDDPVFPSDVWDDVSHLQQRDPQRTGYDNQKPLALLERMILSTSRPGDLVCDLFCGSGSTALAAAQHGRRFLVMDQSPLAVAVTRKRLLGHSMRIDAACAEGMPHLEGRYTTGLGLTDVRITRYALEAEAYAQALEGTQAVDQISVGYLRGETFYGFDHAARTKIRPALPDAMELPILDGLPAVMTVDILGRRLLHIWEDEMDAE